MTKIYAQFRHWDSSFGVCTPGIVGLVISNDTSYFFSQRQDLRFESSVNPEGSKTSCQKGCVHSSFESSVNPEGSKTVKSIVRVTLCLRVV